MTDELDDAYFKNLNKQYENIVNKINLNIKKKNFNYNQKQNQINITALDDMCDVLYNNKNYFTYKRLDKIISYSDNYIKDLQNLLKTLDYDYFDDNQFKKVIHFDENNRFNPKNDKEILFYNCLKRDVFNQNNFRRHIFLFEDKLKEFDKFHNKTTIITFYEDDDLKIIWFILTIS